MKHINLIPARYFPTTVVFVDDNSKFLKNIHLQLDVDTATYRYFSNPKEALYFLTQYKSDPFINHCLLQEDADEFDHRTVKIDISKIHHEIYNINRFKEISVIVLDYTMPGITGAEIAEILKGRGFKIILLTGEANHLNAVQLFNKGRIHYFIRKDEKNATSLLKEAIAHFQKEYMIETSKMVIDSITQKNSSSDQPPSCLSDPIFIQFFDNFIKKNNIAESYLFDEVGSFLLLDKNNKMSWLVVLNEDEMQITEDEMSDSSAVVDSGLLKAIKNRQILRYCFNPAEHPALDKIGKGETLFYPATKIEGKAIYYYSYITKPLIKPLIDTRKIATLELYRRELKE